MAKFVGKWERGKEINVLSFEHLPMTIHNLAKPDCQRSWAGYFKTANALLHIISDIRNNIS